MIITSNAFYPQQFEKLEKLTSFMMQNKRNSAAELILEYSNNLFYIQNPREKIIAQLFLEALSTRLNGSTPSQELYKVSEAKKYIQIFNKVAESFPLINLPKEMANQILTQELNELEEAVIIDIGMATGQQIAHFLEFHSGALPLKKLTVIGIEPSEDSLKRAKAKLEILADQKNIEMVFYGYPQAAESLSDIDFQGIRDLTFAHNSPVLINASFALHHIEPSERTHFLKRLRALNPSCFILIEPSADFMTSNLEEKFQNAWHYYGSLLSVVDSLDLSTEDKTRVKRQFFGPELIDVFAENNRIAQFETAEMWLRRLKDAGFVVPVETYRINKKTEPPISIAFSEQCIGFNVMEKPVSVILEARCD